jgi:hypothetical protein
VLTGEIVYVKSGVEHHFHDVEEDLELLGSFPRRRTGFQRFQPVLQLRANPLNETKN